MAASREALLDRNLVTHSVFTALLGVFLVIDVLVLAAVPGARLFALASLLADAALLLSSAIAISGTRRELEELVAGRTRHHIPTVGTCPALMVRERAQRTAWNDRFAFQVTDPEGYEAALKSCEAEHCDPGTKGDRRACRRASPRYRKCAFRAEELNGRTVARQPFEDCRAAGGCQDDAAVDRTDPGVNRLYNQCLAGCAAGAAVEDPLGVANDRETELVTECRAVARPDADSDGVRAYTYAHHADIRPLNLGEFNALSDAGKYEYVRRHAATFAWPEVDVALPNNLFAAPEPGRA